MQDYDVELVVEEARKCGYAEGYEAGREAGWRQGYEVALLTPVVIERHSPSLADRTRAALDRAADWFARALDFGMQGWR